MWCQQVRVKWLDRQLATRDIDDCVAGSNAHLPSHNAGLESASSSADCLTWPDFGAWQTLPGANHGRTLARCGYDWICVDAEHGNINGRLFLSASHGYG